MRVWADVGCVGESVAVVGDGLGEGWLSGNLQSFEYGFS